MKNFQEYLVEETEVTKAQLEQLEKTLDDLFKDLNVDVEFSRHFHDRLNDERNNKQITIGELRNIYNDLYKRHKPKLKTAKEGIEKLIKSINTHINIPVVFKYNRASGMIEMLAKTVMRKRGFKSSTIALTVK